MHEHDKNLKAILDNASEVGSKFRLDKCEFRVTKTIFLGERLTGDGIKPDPTKIKAVLDIGDPSNKEELQSILGMINLFSKFVQNLAASWDANQEDELSHVKVLLTSTPVITLFDPARNHKVSADSSKDGVGAVLLQEDDDGWHPVAYVSKSMNKSEIEYAQVEKEALEKNQG